MDSLEGGVVGDEKLWTYLTKGFKVNTVSKIKKKNIKEGVCMIK